MERFDWPFAAQFIYINKVAMNQDAHSHSEQESLEEIQELGEFVVEAILDKKILRRKGKMETFYLVKWLGYPKEEDQTWEPLSHLLSVPKLIEAFEKDAKNTKKQETVPERIESSKSQTKQSFKQTAKPQEHLKKNLSIEHQQQAQIQRLKQFKKIHSESTCNRIQQKNTANYLILQQKDKEHKKKLEEKTKQTNKQQSIKVMATNSIAPKRQNPFVESKGHISTLKMQTPFIQYGKIVNHTYKSKQIYYEVELLNKQKKALRTALLPASKIKSECIAALYQYLQNYVVELYEFNRTTQ